MGRSVLGIDAAWTSSNPSGVALAVEEDGGWRLAKAASSYDHFTSHVDLVEGTGDDAGTLLRAAQMLTGTAVTLIAADIPLARNPIVSRRNSDNQISVAYGARHASTHTPNPDRPGKTSTIARTTVIRPRIP